MNDKPEAIIRLQFSTSTAWASAIIRRICHSPFSHVDIVMPPDGKTLLGASDSGDCPVVRGNPNGVAVRPLDYHPFGIRRIVEVGCTKDVSDKFYACAEDQVGKPFDHEAMHAFLANADTPILPRDWRDNGMWFCMEMVIYCLEQAGLFPYPLIVTKARISPGDGLLLLNPYILNIDTFWNPAKGLILGAGEK